MIIVVAQMRLRFQRQARGAAPPPVQMWWFPWLSVIALAGMTTVLVAMAFTPSMHADFEASCVTVLIAVAAYLVVRWRRGPGAGAP